MQTSAEGYRNVNVSIASFDGVTFSWAGYDKCSHMIVTWCKILTDKRLGDGGQSEGDIWPPNVI